MCVRVRLCARCRASMCLRERGAVRSAAVHVYVSAGVCGDLGCATPLRRRHFAGATRVGCARLSSCRTVHIAIYLYVRVAYCDTDIIDQVCAENPSVRPAVGIHTHA